MILAAQLLAGLLLGVLAGACHLALVRVRVRRALTHGLGAAMLLYPVGLLAIALPVVAAAQIAPHAAWATLPGILLARSLLLRRSR